MAGRLAGEVAIITGGASGMGRATALRFLYEGARVVIADMNESTAKETLDLAAGAGHAEAIRFIRTDVSEESDVQAMVALALDEFSRLDCVFNNAGIGGAFGPLIDMRVEDWDYTFAVLTRGVFLGIKHGARAMIEQGRGGSIINTASVAGLSGGGGPLCYSAAKAAVINLGRAAALELAPHRIRVNTICPGGILTPLVHRGNPEAVEKNLESLQPWPEAGKPEHIAGAALFLASRDADFVSGEALVVDGVLTAAGPNLMRQRRESGQGGGIFAGVSGVDRGTTGLEPIVRQAD
ncbi:MAG: SDR family NAD(P)-dependent oxidoreductase [Myxococcota bacterium]